MHAIEKIPNGKQLILFDGVCNFCDNTVLKIIKADKKNVFVFASLQSNFGKEILNYIGIHPKTDSIILYEPGVAYFTESNAAIEIAKQLSGFYPLLQIVQIVPLAFRNKIYQYFAKNRYKWFGKKQNCSIPDSFTKEKFLQ